MADKPNFEELANCLNQASNICTKILENSASTATGSGIPSSTYANMATSSSISLAVQRARSMITASSQRGSFKRLNQTERLRAGGKAPKLLRQTKDTKPEQTKAFEFVLVRSESEEEEPLLLNEESTLLRGFVQLATSATESVIRKAICDAIQTRYPLVNENDFDFVKANRRKLIKPVNCSEYNFKQVKLLAGQGAIYIKIRDGFDCLLTKDTDWSDDEFDDHKEDQQTGTPKSVKPITVDLCEESANDSKADNIKPSELQQVIGDCIQQCMDIDISNPVEILRYVQKKIVTGRSLEVNDPTTCNEGKTNFIIVNRNDVFNSAVEELESFEDFRPTLEVSFYGETAKDLGGPRKEFFRLCLREIKEKYFDKGIRKHLEKDYESAGLIMALSMLQNGNIPRFMSEDILQQLFIQEKPSPCIGKLREGFEKLGIYSICSKMSIFIQLLRPSPSSILSRKQLVFLLKPDFSEEGSNARSFENEVYSSFMTYVREVAAGRRDEITLQHILQFVTCTDEEPVLGFELEPSIAFICAADSSRWSFLPSAHTCTNRLELRRGHIDIKLPSEEDLFYIYDQSFSDAYFGKM